jgi:hypothetical protein
MQKSVLMPLEKDCQPINIKNAPLTTVPANAAKTFSDTFKEKAKNVFKLIAFIFAGLANLEKFSTNETFNRLVRKIGKMKSGLEWAALVSSGLYLIYKIVKCVNPIFFPNYSAKVKMDKLAKKGKMYQPLFLPKLKPSKKEREAKAKTPVVFRNEKGNIYYTKSMVTTMKWDIFLRKTTKTALICLPFFINTSTECAKWLALNNICWAPYLLGISILGSVSLAFAATASIVVKSLYLKRSIVNLCKTCEMKNLTTKEEKLEKLKQKLKHSCDISAYLVDIVEQVALLTIGVFLTLLFVFSITVPFVIPAAAMLSLACVLLSAVIKNTIHKSLERKYTIQKTNLLELKPVTT